MLIDYFHHKLRMMQEVFVQTQSETIMEIMNSTPKYWSVLIDTSRINTLSDLQYYIKYHEESLLQNPDMQTQDLEKHIKALESRATYQSNQNITTHEVEAETNFIKKKTFRKKFIGAHAKFSNYQYPKNDTIVSKGKAPGQKGACPCRHCGSLNHWDFDHPFKGEDDWKAKAFLLNLDSEALEAHVAYENCYLESDSDEETNQQSPIEEQEDPTTFTEDEDFHSSPV